VRNWFQSLAFQNVSLSNLYRSLHRGGFLNGNVPAAATAGGLDTDGNKMTAAALAGAAAEENIVAKKNTAVIIIAPAAATSPAPRRNPPHQVPRRQVPLALVRKRTVGPYNCPRGVALQVAFETDF
jgi:hypothetical protein